MSDQYTVSSSPVGEPLNTAPTCLVNSDDDREIPDSSQMELVHVQDDTPNPRRSKDKQPDFKECGNTDSETQDLVDEASGESEAVVEEIPPQIMAPRVTRSRAKKETENPEKVTPNVTYRPNTRKRSHDGHQNEISKSAKRGRPSTATNQYNKFKKDAQEWVDMVGFMTRELESTKSDNQQLKSQVKHLKSKLDQEEMERDEKESALQQEIEQLQSECTKWKLRVASALDQLKKDSNKYVKVSDSEILESWQLFSYNIRNLVSQCLTENPTDQDMALKWLVVSHRLLSVHDLSSLRSFILQRAIWTNAILPVLSGKQTVWQGEIGATLTRLVSTNSFNHMSNAKYLQIISRMKSIAAIDLADEDHICLAAMKILIDKTMEKLKPFMPDSETEHFKDGIEKLIKQAADLHFIMMKSKAIFLAQWFGDADGKQFATFDQTKMVSLQYGGSDGTSHSLVKFVAAPALVKIGNADGEKFDTSMVLCESSVILEEDDDKADEDGDRDDGGENDEDSKEETPPASLIEEDSNN
ncbi:hypothetical protein V8C35DRAFT_278499 [Trichoderma chlorosporum]